MKTRASSSHDGPPWHDDERPATEAPPDENPDDFPFGDAWEPGDDSPEQERASEEPKEKRRQEQKQQQSRQQNGEDHQQERPPILCAPLTRRPISAIPPRPWAYGHFMLRGHVSMLAGRDGIGKGAQAAAMGVEFVTGRELLGEHIWITGPVCLISYEDDREEWERRIAGVCVHHGIDYERVIEQFHFLSRPGGGAIRFAAAGRHGIVFPDSQDIIAHLKGTRAALLIVDPFNRTHEVEDGNANAPISRVAGEIERVLAESDGATGLLLHHVRKGSTGTADDILGASSSRITFRSNRVEQRMVEKEAETLGVDPGSAWRHFRVSDSKENYAPRPERARWFRLESVSLGNPTPDYPDGDSVQVCVSWKPPDVFDGIALTAIDAIMRKLANGPSDGEFYSPDSRSPDWAGKLITSRAGKTTGEAARIIKGWIKNDVLIEDEYNSPKRKREPFRRVVPNQTKVIEILASLRPSQTGDNNDE